MGDSPAPTSAPDQPQHYAGARVPCPPIPARRYPLSRERFRFFPKLLDEAQHPTSWTFPEYLNPETPWVAALRDLYANPLSFPASFSPEAGLLLHSLIRNIRPRLALEVGSFLGASTLWIAAALEAARADPGRDSAPEGQTGGILHSFDDFGPMASGPWREAEIPTSRLPLIEAYLGKAGLAHRVVLHPGDSGPTVRAWRDEVRAHGSPWQDTRCTGGVDFALIDGDHSIPGVLEDLWAVEPVLNVGGYVLLHDTFPEQCGDHKGPRHVIDHLREIAQGSYELCEIYTAPLNYGMALLRRIG